MMIVKMLGIVLLALVSEATAAIQYPQEWHLWKSEHGITYTVREILVSICNHSCCFPQDELEELRRHITWLSNKAYIDQHNEYADTFGYTLKMNHLGDMVRSLCGA